MPWLAALKLGDTLDQKGQHADFHVRFNASDGPVVHRGHSDLGALERTEAALDDHQPLIAAGGVFQTDGVVVGFDHPLAIVLFRLSDGSTIDADLPGFENTQVALEAA